MTLAEAWADAAPLATSTDVENRLGRTLTTTAELDRVDALLADASAAIRSYTGQLFTRATTTDRLWVRRARALMPQSPVNDVTAVTSRDGGAVSYDWLGPGFEYLELSPYALDHWQVNGGAFLSLPVVDVTYDHGYDAVPADVVAVCTSVALRSYGVNPTDTGKQSESIEGYSYSLGSTAASGPLGLFTDEQRVLDAYRRQVGFIDGGRL